MCHIRMCNFRRRINPGRQMPHIPNSLLVVHGDQIKLFAGDFDGALFAELVQVIFCGLGRLEFLAGGFEDGIELLVVRIDLEVGAFGLFFIGFEADLWT